MTRSVIASGSAVLVVAGLFAIGCSLLGLFQADTAITTAAVATIATGLALFVQAVTVLWRWDRSIQIVGREAIDVFGMCSEIVGGLTGTALGALALRADPIDAPELVAIAMMVLGATLVLGGRTQADLAELAPAARREPDRSPTTFMVSCGVAVAGAGVAMLATKAMLPFGIALAGAAIAFAGGSLLVRFARPVPNADLVLEK